MRKESYCSKDGIEMIRVTKTIAKKLYNKGIEVRCALVNDYVPTEYDIFKVVGFFESFVDECLYYNACSERGWYLKFFVPVDKLRGGVL